VIHRRFMRVPREYVSWVAFYRFSFSPRTDSAAVCRRDVGKSQADRLAENTATWAPLGCVLALVTICWLVVFAVIPPDAPELSPGGDGPWGSRGHYGFARGAGVHYDGGPAAFEGQWIWTAPLWLGRRIARRAPDLDAPPGALGLTQLLGFVRAGRGISGRVAAFAVGAVAITQLLS